MELRNTNEQDTMVVRVTTPVEQLPELMGPSYGKILEYLGPKGVQPSGPPFVAYHNMDMAALDVEIGFPVPSRQEGSGDVQPGKIPGGKVAVTMHTGPYNTIRESYAALSSFIQEQGLKMEAFCYEVYLNDPRETPPEALKTEIYFPIKE
jgi:effector-binding domain-containing protein